MADLCGVLRHPRGDGRRLCHRTVPGEGQGSRSRNRDASARNKAGASPLTPTWGVADFSLRSMAVTQVEDNEEEESLPRGRLVEYEVYEWRKMKPPLQEIIAGQKFKKDVK